MAIKGGSQGITCTPVGVQFIFVTRCVSIPPMTNAQPKADSHILELRPELSVMNPGEAGRASMSLHLVQIACKR